MADRCVLCGATDRLHAHHCGGRPAPGAPYFDDLRVTLCARDHADLHVVLRTLGIDFLPEGRHPLAHRLRRLGVTAELVADVERPFALDPCSAHAFARLVLTGADFIDQEGARR